MTDFEFRGKLTHKQKRWLRIGPVDYWKSCRWPLLVATQIYTTTSRSKYAFSGAAPNLLALTEHHQNMDTNEIVPGLDSKAVFHVSVLVGETIDADNALLSLQEGWTEYATRGACAEESWVSSLSSYLESLLEQRTAHVLAWMDANLERFKAEHANIDNLRRTFSSISAQMKADVELCKAKCLTCNLLCLRGRRHSSHEPHDCQTDHECHHTCEYINHHELDDQQSGCGMP